MSTQDLSAQARLQQIQAHMSEACRLARREGEHVQLVAVSKTFDAEAIRPFLLAGQRVFGENRVQEARDKWPLLRQEFSHIELHLIGPLQTNKVQEAVQLFDVIETLDRDKLAAECAEALREMNKKPRFYVQVNTGQEPQKAGISPQEAVEFVRHCQHTHGLSIDGLMCIPPIDEPPGPHFALLDKLADQANVRVRSMGMSADYEAAILCGATHIRLGSALFGSR